MPTRSLLVGDVFRNAARAAPQASAAALGDEELTFAELDARANGIAHDLRAAGVDAGDRVVVWSATNLRLAAVFAALAKLGAVFVPINPALSPAEATPLLAVADPRIVVADDERAEIATTIGAATIPLAGLDLAAAGGDVPDVPIDERRPHVVFFTSGSTGTPKGTVLSHRVNVLRSHPGALPEPRGAMVCPYPLFHMGAWTIALQQWQARDTVVFLRRADAGAIVDAVERHRATRLNCIPAVWRRVLAHLDGRQIEHVRFADTGTSATPPDLLDGIADAFPRAQRRVFYGSTEAGSVSCLSELDIARKPGSCGVPGPLTEVRIADDGELWARGPLVFDGYLGAGTGGPDELSGVDPDGWYHSGDLAEVDEEGFLTIVGRRRDVIRSGGETVAPGEVEAVLANHPAVADVAVVGVPDPSWGEVVCAAIVPVKGGSPTLEELRRFCEGRLAAYKHPRRLATLDVIPRTAATAQVQRALLAERIATIL